MTRAVDVIRKLCPNARAAYVAAFEAGDDKLAAAGITTPRRLAHFLAQVFHETGDLTIDFENMKYTHAERIRQVWPSRPEAAQYVGDAVGLANCVYGTRMGNRGFMSGDGYRYRGGGLMQTTGRDDYILFGKLCGADFENHPELIVSADYALQPALLEWSDKECNALADKDDITAITRRINGGLEGFAERKKQLARIRPVVGDRVDFSATHAAGTAAATATVAAGAVHAAGHSIWAVGAVLAVGVIAVVAIYVATHQNSGAAK